MQFQRASSILLGIGLVTGLLDPRMAWAGAPTDQLRSAVDKVIGIVTDRPLSRAERDRAIGKVADRIFDFRETTKRALGLNWRGLTDQERAEFEPLFRKLLERAYVSKIEAYRGEQIVYGREYLDGDDATVRTRLITERGTDIPIDYFLLREGDRWRVYDVAIEGISLIDNYRSQFNEIIHTSSYQELVSRLRAKLQEPGPGQAGRSGPRQQPAG
jgi:phospholipid transport system substrate-binding protein